jgi:hypothetical protein
MAGTPSDRSTLVVAKMAKPRIGASAAWASGANRAPSVTARPSPTSEKAKKTASGAPMKPMACTYAMIEAEGV